MDSPCGAWVCTNFIAKLVGRRAWSEGRHRNTAHLVPRIVWRSLTRDWILSVFSMLFSNHYRASLVMWRSRYQQRHISSQERWNKHTRNPAASVFWWGQPFFFQPETSLILAAKDYECHARYTWVAPPVVWKSPKNIVNTSTTIASQNVYHCKPWRRSYHHWDIVSGSTPSKACFEMTRRSC